VGMNASQERCGDDEDRHERALGPPATTHRELTAPTSWCCIESPFRAGVTSDARVAARSGCPTSTSSPKDNPGGAHWGVGHRPMTRVDDALTDSANRLWVDVRGN
jgi:hypothetical protein